MILSGTLELLKQQLLELEKALEKTPEYQRCKEKQMAIEYIESLQKQEKEKKGK